MITGSPEIATAGFMIARCAGPAKYFAVIDEVYRRQASIFQGGAAAGQILQEIARNAGLSEAAFDACIDDQKGLDALNARAQRNGQSVGSTPTFFVNGRQLPDGEHTLAQMGAAIQAVRPAR
jgi:protein-disulfide isomerase